MASLLILASCATKQEKDDFDYTVESFADLEILRYKVPGFEELSLKQKELVYYLSEAAAYGRDILYDQNGKWNLAIRRTLEAIYQNYTGDRESQDFKNFEVYLKRVWFSNGIHHHYGCDKFVPEFSQEFFTEAVKSLDPETLPLTTGASVDDLLNTLTPVIFDPSVMPKRVNQAAGEDLIVTSACNYYDGVTQAEAEAFYNKMKNPKDETPISYGLNSRLVKRDGKIVEETYKVGGLYTEAIEKIVYWLEKGYESGWVDVYENDGVAENEQQKEVIEKLIDYYQTGDLKQFDEYAILWVKDLDSQVDFVNGFTETYGDPLGMKASWESIVNFKNLEASERTHTISDNAQWFEDNSPVDSRFKKDKVKGVSAKVITAAMLAGDCYPSTPIGINLPNSNWIRHIHGSKSVTIENITEAYEKAAQGNGFNDEFVWSDTERNLMNNYLFQADNLHTDLHECLGHGSGKLLPGVDPDNLHTDLHECLGHASGKLLPGTDPDALKAYSSTLEEARADLFALYYMADPKILELGLLPSEDAYKAAYYKYMMNGLMTQLTRIEPGKNIEESHMRNRQLIARWAYEHGKADNVVEFAKRDGKTYVVINDYEKLRSLFGKLLAEVQRIKSEGDYESGKNLVEEYGVIVDQDLHNEVLARYENLHIAPYKGFVNPVYTPITDENGNITDIQISYNEGYAEQMLRYSKDYSPLPIYTSIPVVCK